MVLYPHLYSTVNQNQIHLHVHTGSGSSVGSGGGERPLDQYLCGEALQSLAPLRPTLTATATIDPIALPPAPPPPTDITAPGSTGLPHDHADRKPYEDVTAGDPANVWRPY